MAWAVSSSLRGASATKQSQRDCHAPLRRGFVGLAMTGGLVVAVFYLLFQILVFFIADLAYNRGRAYADAGYVEEAMEPLMRAVNLVPGEPVFRAELAESEGTLAVTLLNQERSLLDVRQGDSLSETIAQLKDDSLANFGFVRSQSPYNLGFARSEARVMFLLGEEDRIVQLMKAAMEMAPTNPQLPYSLGAMLTKMGQEKEAAVYYKKAVELKPDYAEALKEL